MTGVLSHGSQAVRILKGQKQGECEVTGQIYDIEGIEITKQRDNKEEYKVVYPIDDPFYKAAAAENTISSYRLLINGNILLK